MLIRSTGWSKNGTLFVRLDRFTNLSHCQNLKNICNNTVTNDPTTPHCVATLPCKMSVSSKQQLKQDDFCNNMF